MIGSIFELEHQIDLAQFYTVMMSLMENLSVLLFSPEVQ